MKICNKKLRISKMKAFGVTLALILTVLLISCNSSSENLQNAKEEMKVAQENLNEAHQKYTEEVRLFRMEVAEKITVNDKKIAEVNTKIRNSKNELKQEYENQLAILEQNNKNLKIKMENYKADSKENWTSFKDEFNKDLDRLGEALKNFTVKN